MSTLKDFRVRMKQTTSTTVTSWEGGWTTYFGPTDIPKTDLVVGSWKEYLFSSTTGLDYDGTSNIMVDISRDDTAYSSGGGMYKRENIGTNRMFAGACDSCTLYNYTSGTSFGAIYTFCPSLKLNYIPK